MHIPDGFLSPQITLPAYAISAPLWAWAAKKHFGRAATDALPVIGSLTALAFVIQTIMIPVPGGTSTHLVGVTLLALLYHPLVAFVCESLVLLLQALFFGAGGITVLGVNALAMGLLGPFAGWLVHRLLRGLSERWATFLAGYAAMQVSTVAAALTLGLQHRLSDRYFPMPLEVTFTAMMVPSLTIAGVVEGLYTVFALSLLRFASRPASGPALGGLGGAAPAPPELRSSAARPEILLTRLRLRLRARKTAKGESERQIPVASAPDPRYSRALLAGWVVAVFAISSTSDLRVLGAAAAAAALAFHGGIGRTLRRVLRSVVPVTAALSLASWGWLRLVTGRAPEPAPFFALGLRTVLISFVTFAVLARVDLFRALAPWPTLTRLLVVTLAQIHALRLLATESLLGLRSRMPRKPGALDVLRGAGGITGALFTLSTRNARDISDAMRSRGF